MTKAKKKEIKKGQSENRVILHSRHLARSIAKAKGDIKGWREVVAGLPRKVNDRSVKKNRKG